VLGAVLHAPHELVAVDTRQASCRSGSGSGAENSILASASAPSLAVVTLYPDFFRLTSRPARCRIRITKRSCFFATRFHLPVVPRVRDTGSVEGFHPAVKLSRAGVQARRRPRLFTGGGAALAPSGPRVDNLPCPTRRLLLGPLFFGALMRDNLGRLAGRCARAGPAGTPTNCYDRAR